MMKEQYIIIKNIPDGVLIHKQLFQLDQNNYGLSSLIHLQSNATSIQYFNKTFKNFFGLPSNFDQINPAETTIQTGSASGGVVHSQTDINLMGPLD